MERAERLVCLGIGVLFSQLLVPMLFLMLALTSLTAVQRFVKVWRQASIERPQTVRMQRRAVRRRNARAARGPRRLGGTRSASGRTTWRGSSRGHRP
jgi:CDP-diacylglycerol--glycerol-3-phosphate 3-phosphatidyltransferase